MASPSDSRRRALITGIDGFTGRYVAEELEQAGYEVVGLGRAGDSEGRRVHAVDICDREAVQAFVSSMDFDVVIHLAAISFVQHGDAEAIYRVNVVGTRNLLEALAAATRRPRVVVLASSANIYGNAADDPITEHTRPAPANDYAVSKLAMEHMAWLWQDRLPIVIVRPFNYTGVGQSPRFLVAKIVDHYARGERSIELGNTDVVRDFLDVRDVARLYAALAATAPVGQTVNLCSGRGVSLQQVLRMAGDIAGYQIEVRINPDFVRSNEVKRLVGSTETLKRLVPGFEARPFAETLGWMIVAGEA